MRLALVISCCFLFITCVHVKVSDVKVQQDTLAKLPGGKEKLTDTVKNELAADIATLVHSGFYDKNETLDQVNDMYADFGPDKTWVKKQADSDYAALLKQQLSWPATTDFDRLAAVFDKLNAEGIIAYHNAGATREDGEEICKDLADTLKAQGVKTRGYCFYHWQDIEGALENKNLYIAFGSYNQDDKGMVAIGNIVVKTLEVSGFRIRWNGRPDNRIEIINFSWQKRFGNANCSYERAVALLKKAVG